jgi:hypothetical protein
MDDDARRRRLAEDGLPPPEILDAWEVPDPSRDAIDRMFTAAFEPDPGMERPMHATPRRSLFTSVAVGFLVAAGLLLSFWIGRSSVEPIVVDTPPPSLPPAAPAAEPAITLACPEPEPAPECPAVETVEVPVPMPVPEVAPRPPRKRAAPPAARDLKDPFASKSVTLHLGTNKGAGPAEVFIDGKRRGMTPLPNIKVLPGRHTVRFKFPTGREITRRIDVSDGETHFVKVG